jgi:hypothetical protein
MTMRDKIMDLKLELPKVYSVTFHEPGCADARCVGCTSRKRVFRVRGVRKGEKRS